MLEALNSEEPIRPVKLWQTSIHSPAGEGAAVDFLIVTNVTSRGARGGCPRRISIVFCAWTGPGMNAHIFCLCPTKDEAHTPGKGERKRFEMWQGDY